MLEKGDDSEHTLKSIHEAESHLRRYAWVESEERSSSVEGRRDGEGERWVRWEAGEKIKDRCRQCVLRSDGLVCDVCES